MMNFGKAKHIAVAAAAALLFACTPVFGGLTAFAAEGLIIPDNYAAIVQQPAVKWGDIDSTGHKTGAVIEKEIDGFGTLICYYVPDDYAYSAVITRESDKGTFCFAIGYLPDGPAEYKKHKAALLCEPGSTPDDPPLTVQDLVRAFGAPEGKILSPADTATTATATAPTTAPPSAKPSTVTPTPKETPALSDAEFAAEVIRLINTERARLGVKPLAADDKLCEVAGLKAKEMVELKYFSHVSPNYGHSWEFARHYGWKGTGLGENLYWAADATPQMAFDWWMGSHAHKAAMLNAKYTKVGFGGCGNKYALELAQK